MNDTEKRTVYTSALSKINSEKIDVLRDAIGEFSRIPDYRDSEQRIVYCKDKIAELEKAGKRKKSITRLAILAGVCCLAIVGVMLAARGIVTSNQEKEANIDHYNTAISYLDEGRLQEAALEFGKAGNYEDAQERSQALWRDLIKPSVISIGTFTMNNHIVGLKTDGTVVATGRNSDGQCNVSDWKSILSVSAGFSHTVGLKTDGTVVAVGSNSCGQCNVTKWKNIVQAIAGDQCTIGLRTDGTVLFAGFDSNGEDECESWENIVRIWVEGDNVIGKSLDGKIVCIRDYLAFSDDSNWSNLKKVTFSYDCGIFGLTQDNTVVYEKASHHPNDQPYYDSLGIDEAQYWTDVIDIDGGLRNIVGIRADGSVIFAGSNEDGQNDISDWRDIVVISTEGRQTIGVKSDGSVLLVGDISWGIDVSGWTDIMIP